MRTDVDRTHLDPTPEDREAAYWRRVPAPLHYTMLGHYLASNQDRWLLAFATYAISYIAIFVMFVIVVSHYDNPGKAMAIFEKSKLVLTAVCFLLSIGSFASYRFKVAFGTGIAFLLFLFVHVLSK